MRPVIMENLESRCKHYETTSNKCKCHGFKFRGACKHTKYLADKENAKIGLIEIVDGTFMDDAIKKYNNVWIKGMIRRGELWFDRGTGKLYNLK